MFAAKYWKKYYEQNKTRPPSAFARFCTEKYMLRPLSVIDAGCGCGSDSVFFASLGHEVVGIDASNLPTSSGNNPHFLLADACDVKYDVQAVYCRWLLHAMREPVAHAFLCKVSHDILPQGLVFIECRSDNDKTAAKGIPHFRRSVNMMCLKRELEGLGFAVPFFGESRGWSIRGDDDPLLIRMVGQNQLPTR